MEKWLFEQSLAVILCVSLLHYACKGIAAFYRDWMGKDSFAKDFFVQHKRIADASVEQVSIGQNLVDEMSGMKEQISSLEAKVGNVEQGLKSLTTEVKNHPPTREVTSK